jgi:hypothetical protein
VCFTRTLTPQQFWADDTMQKLRRFTKHSGQEVALGEVWGDLPEGRLGPVSEAAAIAGTTERTITAPAGHGSAAIRAWLARYIRDGSLFRENAASKVGL